MRWWFLWPGIFALAVVVVAQPASANVDSIAWVTDMLGAWSVNGNPLVKGEGLPASGIVRAIAPANTDVRIHITLRNGERIDETCSQDLLICPFIALPSDLSPQSSFINRIIDAVRRFLLRQPKTHGTGMVRVGYTLPGGKFKNAVLLLQGHRLDVNPTFYLLPAAVYTTRFVPLDSTGRERSSGRTVIIVHWNGHHIEPQPTPALRTGLYEIQSEDIESAPVLIADRKHFADLSNTYARISADAQRWGANVSDDERSAFLHASVIELANPPRSVRP